MQDAELLSEFVEEAREHLSDVEMQLLQIEAMGADINDDLVNTVFRAIHSVKGAAGFLGLTQINNVSHRLENVLGKVRDHQLIPDPFKVDVMLKAADRVRTLIEEIETSNETDNSELCEKLDALLSEKTDDTLAAPETENKITPEAQPTRSEASEGKPTPAEEPDAAKKPVRKRKTTARKSAGKKARQKKPRQKKPRRRKRMRGGARKRTTIRNRYRPPRIRRVSRRPPRW